MKTEYRVSWVLRAVRDNPIPASEIFDTLNEALAKVAELEEANRHLPGYARVRTIVCEARQVQDWSLVLGRAA